MTTNAIPSNPVETSSSVPLNQTPPSTSIPTNNSASSDLITSQLAKTILSYVNLKEDLPDLKNKAITALMNDPTIQKQALDALLQDDNFWAYATNQQSIPQSAPTCSDLPPNALYNLGSTCFANATLQCFFHTPFLLSRLLFADEDKLQLSTTYSYENFKNDLSAASLPAKTQNQSDDSYKAQCDLIKLLRILYIAHMQPQEEAISRPDIYDALHNLFDFLNEHPSNNPKNSKGEARRNINFMHQMSDPSEMFQLIFNILEMEELDPHYGIHIAEEYISENDSYGLNPQTRKELLLSTGYHPNTLPENLPKTLSNIVKYTFAKIVDHPDTPPEKKEKRKFHTEENEIVKSHREYLKINDINDIPNSVFFTIQRYAGNGTRDDSEILDFDKPVSLIFKDNLGNQYIQNFQPTGLIPHEGFSLNSGHYTALSIRPGEYKLYNDSHKVQSTAELPENAKKYFQKNVYVVLLEKTGNAELLEAGNPALVLPERNLPLETEKKAFQTAPEETFLQFLGILFYPLIWLVNQIIYLFKLLYHWLFNKPPVLNPAPNAATTT